MVLVDVLNGTVVGKVETGREKAAEGENGMSDFFSLLTIALLRKKTSRMS